MMRAKKKRQVDYTDVVILLVKVLCYYSTI